jgi:ribosomal protein S18 acetylase RimI-like enzyme
MPEAIHFRPIEDADLPFLYAVYASTREEELAQTAWSEEEKKSFLRMQFEAQHQHYQKHYARASFAVVLQGEVPIGRLYVHRGESDIRIVDIALLPEHRGGGIGSRLLGEILEEARQAGRKVSIHVEHFNPALRLYERLGFTRVDDTGVYYRMEWVPA